MLAILGTLLCLHLQPSYVIEDQGSYVFALTLTNPSSEDMVVIVAASDVLTTGELMITVCYL